MTCILLSLALGAAALAANPGAGAGGGGHPAIGDPAFRNPAGSGVILSGCTADPGQALVSGTSTLHDWTVKSGTIDGKAVSIGQWKAGSAPPILIQSISLVIPVKSLKSTEGSGMDDKVYEALNLKKFPNITYALTRATLKASPTGQNPEYRFDTIGQLTVAGNARPVKLDLHVLPADGGRLTITTEIGVKMTDFNVTPPTAMLGLIKSGDAITLKVTWQLVLPSSPPEDRK